MNTSTPALLLGGAAVALIFLCAAALGQGAAASQPDPDAVIAALRKAVLANPMDAAAADKLRTAKAAQAGKRRDALDSLIDGLNAYVEGRRGEAAGLLKAASDNTFARELANKALLVPLDEMIKRCTAAGKGPAPAAKICTRCGGAAEISCSTCAGTGLSECPDCKGLGRRRGAPVMGPFAPPAGVGECFKCRGAGSVECAKCFGQGFEDCPACTAAPKPAPGAEAAVGGNEARAIRKVVAMAAYARGRGLDLTAPGALDRAPKM